jgi:hypothetical protein
MTAYTTITIIDTGCGWIATCHAFAGMFPADDLMDCYSIPLNFDSRETREHVAEEVAAMFPGFTVR